MEYIYIMACQRGQGGTEIFSMWDSYEKSIIAYYNYHIKDGYGKRQDSSDYWFMYLYKFPVNMDFSTDFCGHGGSSDIKIQKSSKYRIKFKNWGELKKEYTKVYITENRNDKLIDLGI